MDEQIKESLYMHKMELFLKGIVPFTITWRNLEDIMHSEKNPDSEKQIL